MLYMKYFFALILFAVLALLAVQSQAVTDPIGLSSQGVLSDAACTDDFDTPAVGTQALPQTTGSADGLCDGDTKVLTGTLSVDTLWGPFVAPRRCASMYIWADADTVSGGTPTWKICIQNKLPWLNSYITGQSFDCTGEVSGTGLGFFGVGPETAATAFDLADPAINPLPRSSFKILLELVAATDWAGSLAYEYVCGGAGN